MTQTKCPKIFIRKHVWEFHLKAIVGMSSSLQKAKPNMEEGTQGLVTQVTHVSLYIHTVIV